MVAQEHLMVADTPSEFAEWVVRLLTDRELRDRISSNARQFVKTHYDWSGISRKLMAAYSSMVSQNRGLTKSRVLKQKKLSSVSALSALGASIKGRE